MNLYHEVIRPMHPLHATSILILCSFLACAPLKHAIDKDGKEIIKLELQSYQDFGSNDKIIFNYLSNQYVIDQLQHAEDISNYFSNEEIEFMIDKLGSMKDESYKFNLPKNYFLENELALDTNQKLSMKRINISAPTINNDHKIALLAFSYGHKNALEGGIKIYCKINGKWTNTESFNLWVE